MSVRVRKNSGNFISNGPILLVWVTHGKFELEGLIRKLLHCQTAGYWATNAGGGAMCCRLIFQTMLQPVRMAHPSNLSHPSRVGSAIFNMQVAEGCEVLRLDIYEYANFDLT